MEGTEPKYAAFAEFVRDKIRSGEWPPGHRLPSQAMWAAGTPGHKVLYGSMRAGYITLKTEGWIDGQQGEGVFVAENPPCKLPEKSVAPVAVETAARTTKRTKRS